MLKPALFVGSSTEGIEFARGIRHLLEQDAEVTLWNDGVFALSATLIEGLVDAVQRFDFAALVLTPDDLLLNRESEVMGPRDNVIFELGLFMGRIGRDRTFMVRPRSGVVKLPTDLAGVTAATYEWPRSDDNHRSAVGPACDRIREHIRNRGLSSSRTTAHIQAVETEQQRQKSEIDALSFVIAHFLPFFEVEHLDKLKRDEKFPYRMHPGFEKELRHLWELGFIRKKSDFKILGMPEEGNLDDYFAITEQGQTYLALRDQVRSTHAGPTDELSGYPSDE
jgi:Predicted nucleotide-binding protein containing TIR-like domain